MSTQIQRDSYAGFGNEILFPLATDPAASKTANEGARAILEDRGNVITAEGRLQKTRTTKYRDNYGVPHELIEVVENGKMVSRTVDGVSITGNIVQF